jgi:hypothetical protein
MPTARLIAEALLTRGRTYSYGPHPSQRCDLHLPASAGPHPAMVLIHGGAWRKRYGKIVMRALARDLVRRGWAVWNIEYRRLGIGGGHRLSGHAQRRRPGPGDCDGPQRRRAPGRRAGQGCPRVRPGPARSCR